jgi:hypothetical protein
MEALVYVLVILLAIFYGILSYNMVNGPSEEEEIDDPTTTCWHDDDHYHRDGCAFRGFWQCLR